MKTLIKLALKLIILPVIIAYKVASFNWYMTYAALIGFTALQYL